MTQIRISAVAAASALALCAAMASNAGAASLSEDFATVPPTGWTVVNNSTTAGTASWFQGSTAVFSAYAGASNSYAGVNFNSTTGASTISNWLITPTLSFDNGDVLSFYSRTVDVPSYPDRLEVRFSNVGGTSVGATPTSVGTFTTLLLTVNPSLTTTGYPSTWTNYTATISGLSGPTPGAIAFRYFVTNGGPSGLNSDYIGIDSVSITPVPEPTTYLMMALGLCAIGLRSLRASRA